MLILSLPFRRLSPLFSLSLFFFFFLLPLCLAKSPPFFPSLFFLFPSTPTPIPVRCRHSFRHHTPNFEVHHHWLALIHSLPLSVWYSDETSQLTLDYPSFFAHFEHFLSHFAALVDPTIVDLHNGLNYTAPSVVIFQRLTVILADVVLFFSIYQLGVNLGG